MRSAGHDRLKRPGHNPLALDIVPREAPGLVVRVLSRIRVLNRAGRPFPNKASGIQAPFQRTKTWPLLRITPSQPKPSKKRKNCTVAQPRSANRMTWQPAGSKAAACLHKASSYSRIRPLRSVLRTVFQRRGRARPWARRLILSVWNWPSLVFGSANPTRGQLPGHPPPPS